MKYLKNNDLYTLLNNNSRDGSYPFHMPGHKRNEAMLGNQLPYRIDITEIDGFDNLHAAEGVLKAITDKAQRVFHSEHSYMLINGSTCGLLAAISSVVNRGDSIVVARNCHKSVYNACFLAELDMRFIYPHADKIGICGSVEPISVKTAIEECPSAKAVVITSPTYEGVISDVRSIAEICHSAGIPLIVDAAHGAHLPFCSFGTGCEPVSCGADIVVNSLHKTLPSLTQTAMAHLNGTLVSAKRFERYLGVYETSSPSYILMASIERCIDFLEVSRLAFAEYERRLQSFSEQMRELSCLSVLCCCGDSAKKRGFFGFDKGKIVISTNGADISGVELVARLRREYGLELEMAYPTYALAMTSVCDSAEGIERLAAAILEIDKTLKPAKQQREFPQPPRPMHVRITNAELENLPNVDVTPAQLRSGQFIGRRMVYAYPPGIPIVIPGDIITQKEYDYIKLLERSGITIEFV